MKKITAMVCSLIMICTVCAGCGNSDSSSAAESTAATTTSAAASESTADSSSETADDTSAPAESTAENSDMTLAAAYTQSLADKHFSIDMTVSSDYTGEMPMSMTMCDNDFYLSMNAMGMSIEMYLVDNTAYIVDSANKTYAKQDAEGMSLEDEGVSSFGLSDSYTYVSTENTDDGLVCETYSIDDSSFIELGSGVTLESTEDSSESTSYAKYYFDASTNELKKIEMNTMGMLQTVTIDSFSTEVEFVELPDFTDWTESDAASLMGLSTDTSIAE